MDNYELYHHGIKGQRWGIRRYQNPDGSLTEAGKRRQARDEYRTKKYVAKQEAKAEKYKAKLAKKEADKVKAKSVKDMSDEELATTIKRLQSEDQYLKLQRSIASMTPKHVSKGEAFVKHIGNNVLKPALTESGKAFMTDYLKKSGNQVIKNAFPDDKNSTDALKKRVDKLNLEKKEAELKDYFEKRNSGEKTSKSDDGTLTDREKSDIAEYIDELLEERELYK